MSTIWPLETPPLVDEKQREAQTPHSGVLRRVLVEPNPDTEGGTPLAILADADADIIRAVRTTLKG